MACDPNQQITQEDLTLFKQNIEAENQHVNSLADTFQKPGGGTGITQTGIENAAAQQRAEIQQTADDAINTYRRVNAGFYSTAPFLEDEFTYTIFQGGRFYAVNPPYQTIPGTIADPNNDINLQLLELPDEQFVRQEANGGDSLVAGGSIWPLSSQDSVSTSPGFDNVPPGTVILNDATYGRFTFDPIVSGAVTAWNPAAGQATIGGTPVILTGLDYSAANVSNMSSRTFPYGATVRTKGFNSIGDGGAAEYIIESGVANGTFRIGVGGGLVARLNTQVPTNKQLGQDTVDSLLMLTLSDNGYDGCIIIDGTALFNAVHTYNNPFYLKGINSTIRTLNTPPAGTFYVNTQFSFIIDGFELESGSAAWRVLKSSFTSEYIESSEGKSIELAGGGYSLSKVQIGAGEGKFSTSAVDLHNYTDAPGYRIDNVGSSPAFFAVAARNEFRRYDRPSNYIGTGDFIDLSITRSDTYAIEQLFTISVNGSKTYFNAETQVGNTSFFKRGVSNIVRFFAENASNIQENFFTWFRDGDGNNTIATAGEDYIVGNFSDTYEFKSNSITFSTNETRSPLWGFTPISSTFQNNCLYVESSTGNLIFRDGNGILHTVVSV